MKPEFVLPRGYVPRRMVFALSKEGERWAFYGVSFDEGIGRRFGYAVLASFPPPYTQCKGRTFRTRAAAAMWAARAGLPAYCTWNGRTRCYEGLAFEAMAYPRP